MQPPAVRAWRLALAMLTLAFPVMAGAEAAPPHSAPGNLHFIANHGQFAPDIRYAAMRGQAAIALGDGFLRVLATDSSDEQPVLRAELRWLGASPRFAFAPVSESKTRFSFFFGQDPARWQPDLPAWEQLRVQNLYPGIDLLLYQNGDLLEFDYIVHPGADPSRIAWQMTGDIGVAANEQGHLAMDFAAGRFLLREPVAFQEAPGGRHPVDAAYVQRADGTWRFELGAYNRALPLIIDPILSYSTYYGGTQFDQANAIITDTTGNVFIAGETWSTGLLLANHVQNVRKAGKDVFVLKLNSIFDGYMAATYFGGNGDDIATSLALVGSDLVVAGETTSTDLPGTSTRYQAQSGGGKDGFITRLRLHINPAVTATTYLGGFGSERINAITRDASGNLYAAGFTTSSNFPLSTPSFGPQYLGGTNDAFLVKFHPALTSVFWSGIYGGLGSDNAEGLALGAGGTVWITGSTSSASIPLVKASQGVLQGAFDCFVAHVAADGRSLLLSTYIGGGLSDFCYAIQTDAAGNPVVAGSSASSNFPVTSGVVQTARSSNYDNVLFRLDAATGAVQMGTYLGGNNTEAPTSLHRDGAGNWCLAGYTYSTNFPVFDAIQQNPGGSMDGFFSCLNSTGTALVFSTYLGGAQEDRITGAMERPGSLTMLTGLTQSTNFPTAGTALQTFSKGSGDAFVTGIHRSATNAPPVNVSVTPSNGSTETAQLTYTVDDANGWGNLRFLYTNIHNAVSSVGACYVQYDIDNRLLRLLNDAGSNWVDSATPGERKILQNSQCRIDAERSFVHAHATRMNLTIQYMFQPGFGGVKSLLMYSQDRANAIAGWQLRGGWVVPALAGNVQPAVTYFAPNNGTFPQNAFVMQVTDLNGANDVNEVHLLANASFNYASACYVRYQRSLNRLQLLNDSTSAFLGSLTPGASGSIENSKCIVTGTHSSATISGNVLSLVVYLSFKAMAGGTNQLWTLVNDQSNAFLGWKSQGSFTVPLGPTFTRPVAQSLAVTPLSTTTARITATGYDENGSADLAEFYMLVNTALSNAGGCYLRYRSATNQVLLLNDAGNNWQGSGTLGGSAILENSQCRVNLALATVTDTQDTRSVAYTVEFKPAFHGTRAAYLYVEDAAKLISGWQFFGNLSIPFP